MKDDIKAAIRADYAAGMSLRRLHDKYGLPKSTIADMAKKYGWPKAAVVVERRRAETVRRAIKENLQIPDRPDTGQQIPDRPDTGQGSEDYEVLRRYAEKLLGKVDQLLDLEEALAPRDLKSVSSMLLDVRTLLNVLSPREMAEQKARLRNLEKQSEETAQASEPTVITFVNTEGAES